MWFANPGWRGSPNRAALDGGGPAAIAGTTYYLAEGDSRTHSTAMVTAPGDLYPAQIMAAELFVVENTQAVDGSTLTDMIGRATADDALKTANPGFANYVLTAWIGVNSAIGAGDYVGNASGFLTAFASYCDARRTAGWKVVVCTELPAYTGTDATAYSSWRATVNAGIKTWLGVHADAIADIAADPNIGPDGSQLTAYWNSDNLHPNTLAHNIIAPIVRAAIQSIATAADVDAPLAVQTTWDPTKKHSQITLSGSPSNSVATPSAVTPVTTPAVMSVNSHVRGRRHIEIVFGGANTQNVVGPCRPTLNSYTEYPGEQNAPYTGLGFSWIGPQNGNVHAADAYLFFVEVSPQSTSNFGAGHTMMIEINFDLGYIWTGRDGTWDTVRTNPLINPNYTFRPYLRWFLGAAPVGSLNSYTLPTTPSFMMSGASPF
jgi:hypothetical protein